MLYPINNEVEMPRLQKFDNASVELDGQTFDGCVFVGCDLIYRGGQLPVFGGCSFQSCEWRLLDAAIRTLAFLLDSMRSALLMLLTDSSR